MILFQTDKFHSCACAFRRFKLGVFQGETKLLYLLLGLFQLCGRDLCQSFPKTSRISRISNTKPKPPLGM